MDDKVPLCISLCRRIKTPLRCLPCHFLSPGRGAGYILQASSKISCCYSVNDWMAEFSCSPLSVYTQCSMSDCTTRVCCQQDPFSVTSFESSQLMGLSRGRVVTVAGMDEPGPGPQTSRQLWRYWVIPLDAVPEKKEKFGVSMFIHLCYRLGFFVLVGCFCFLF